MELNSSGLCHCGCGGQTAPAPASRNGYRKGDPQKFIKGHIGGLNSKKVYEQKITTLEDGSVLKRCTKCGKSRPLSDFGELKSTTRADHTRSHCRSCGRIAANAFYAANPTTYRLRARQAGAVSRPLRLAKANALRVQSGCTVCEETEPCVLDFHHLHGNSKGKLEGMSVGRAACQSEKRFRKELAKCIVVCVSCHRKIHAGVVILSSDLIENGKARISRWIAECDREAGSHR
jgi:hypothetical protein